MARSAATKEPNRRIRTFLPTPLGSAQAPRCSSFQYPVELELEVLVAGLADPAPVGRDEAFDRHRDAVRHAGPERQPAELAVVVLGPFARRPVRLVPQQLLAKPILSLQTPIVGGDHLSLTVLECRLPPALREVFRKPRPSPDRPLRGRRRWHRPNSG